MPLSRLLDIPGALALAALIALALPGHARAEQTELSITAAFLTKVLDYVEWHDQKPERFTICVAGDETVVKALRERIEEQKLSRTMTVRMVDTSRTVTGCTSLFIDSATYPKGAGLLLANARGREVLTVGTAPDFLKKGGSIQLQFQDRKLSFGINTKAAAKNRITFSALLLKLARQVL